MSVHPSRVPGEGRSEGGSEGRSQGRSVGRSGPAHPCAAEVRAQGRLLGGVREPDKWAWFR
jgi:hypothetical protein